MTFLAPIALIGLLLLILPIVVHLFKPRKMTRTPFSSLRWLKETRQRLSRRIQWHQWLLFLLRAGCIVLLVVALAQPILGPRPVARIVIVDVSRSMARQVQDEATPLEHATALASRLVQADRFSVIVAGSSPRLVPPSSAGASIKTLKPGLGDGNLSAALPLARSLLPRQGDVELIFLTDNLQGRWRQQDVQEFVKDLPGTAKVKIVETGPGAVHNAWIAGGRLLQFGVGEDRWIRAQVGCNKEPRRVRTVRLTGISGVSDETQVVALEPGQLARVDFRLPANLNLDGQVAELRLEPADALPSDDVYLVNLDIGGTLRVLLIEPELPGPDGRSAGLFLQTAMKALAASKNQAPDVTVRTSANVTAMDIEKADVVMLAGVPELADVVVDSLEKRVHAGAGLALFLGPQLKPAFANQKLYRAQQPAEGLLPLEMNSVGSGRPEALADIRWTHPLLAPLRDPVLSDFTHSRFRGHAKLAGSLSKNDTVLARFEDDVPAILEHPVGAGRVVVLNTSANDEWSDLPKRKSFVPFVDGLLAYLSAGGVQRSFTVGDAVTMPLPDMQAKSAVTVIAPNGAKLSPRLLMQRGQTLVHLEEVTEVGAFRIDGAGKKSIIFTVNAPRRDSALEAMDVRTLEEWWSPVALERLDADSARQQLEQQSSRWPLWPALVFLAGVLLVAETVYVHRLCPRANPKAADAVVSQRGMMKPVEQKS